MEGEIQSKDIRMFGGAPESVEPIEILVLPTSGISFPIRHENSEKTRRRNATQWLPRDGGGMRIGAGGLG